MRRVTRSRRISPAASPGSRWPPGPPPPAPRPARAARTAPTPTRRTRTASCAAPGPRPQLEPACIHARRFAIPPWVTTTPFGRPVDPDVYITYAGARAAASPLPPPAHRPPRQPPARRVIHHHRGHLAAQHPAALRRRRHQHRARIGEHERDPLGRVPRVNRQVRRPGLQHRQQRRHQLRAAPSHRHHRLRARPRPASYPASRPARASSSAYAPLTPARHRHRIRGPRRLRREQLRQRRRHLHRGVIPPRQHLLPLGRAQHLHRAPAPPGRRPPPPAPAPAAPPSARP